MVVGSAFHVCMRKLRDDDGLVVTDYVATSEVRRQVFALSSLESIFDGKLGWEK